MTYNTIRAIAAAAGVFLTLPAASQESAAPASWRNDDQSQRALKDLAGQYRPDASLATIGASLEGRNINVLQLARDGSIDPGDRPALLVVAGIDASRPHTSWCAVEVARTLLERAAGGDEDVISFLETNTLYIVPRLNPDGHERNRTHAIKHAHARNMRTDDADRDRASDEDGPDDLNGDGMITMMRVHDPRKADLVADPDDPRLDRKPDREEGERASFYLLSEGHDNDEDGRHNEDAAGGVDLDMNFMHGYQHHADGAGRHQLSEPEAMSLLQFALEHQNIAAVVVYGRHDTLSSPPSASGRNDAGGPNTIENDDQAMYERVSERFIELTDLKGVPSGDWSGSFAAWAYAQYGVPSFSTPLWTMPRSGNENGDGDAEDGDQADRPRGGPPGGDAERPRGGQGGRGNFDWEAMRDEYDANKDGELDDDERDAMREAMRERFGGRGGPGGGRGGPGAGGPPDGAGGGGRGGRGGRGGGRGGGGSPGGGQNLTPSQYGDISQETIDELMESARENGMEISEEQMSQVTPEMIEMFAERAGIEIRRVTSDTGNRGRRDQGAPSDEDWLKYSDETRDGSGFVEWTRVDHPEYDHVEVGGWAPGFRTIPPIDEMDPIVEVQADFLVDLAAHLPDVQLQDVEVEQLADGLWTVRASLVNEGRLPAGTAMAKRNRRARPWVVRLGVDPDRIVTGRPTHKVWTIEPDGGRHEMRWVVEHPDGEELEIELFSEKYGGTVHAITMTGDGSNGGGQ